MSQMRVTKKTRKTKQEITIDLSELKSIISTMLMPITNSINNLNEKVMFLVNAWNKRENGEGEKRTFGQEFASDIIAADTLRLSKNYSSLKDQVGSYQKNLQQVNDKLASIDKLLGVMVKRQNKRKAADENNWQHVEYYLSPDKKDHTRILEVEPATTTKVPLTALDTGPMQVLTLNDVDDFPQGSWLGDPEVPQSRVRCPLRPEDLVYINMRCATPEKMALTLLDYLFSKEILSTSNLSGKSKLGKKRLDPLMIYGIKCHLMHNFSINEKQWERIKLNIDSKCRSAWRKRRPGSEYCISVDAELYQEDSQSQDSLNDFTGTLQVENETNKPKKRVIRTLGGDIEVLSTENILHFQDFHNIHVLDGDNILPIISSDGEEMENGITLNKCSEQSHLAIVAEESDTSHQDRVSFIMEPMLEVLAESSPLSSAVELLEDS